MNKTYLKNERRVRAHYEYIYKYTNSLAEPRSWDAWMDQVQLIVVQLLLFTMALRALVKADAAKRAGDQSSVKQLYRFVT